MLIPLSLYMCLCHGLKMCMLFGYNPQIIFSVFHKMNLVIFPVKVNRYKTQGILLMPIHLKLNRCLGHGLKMCILFGYNPQIIFVRYSQNERTSDSLLFNLPKF